MSGPEPPQLTWMLTSDAWPNARWPRGPDFTAFHGELLVGRVFQHQDGPEKGLWFWTMSVERSGWSSPGPTSGVEPQHGEAGRQVVEAYHALLKRSRDAPEREQPLAPEAAPSEAQPKPPNSELSRQQRRYQERQLKKQQRQIERQAKRQVGWKER
jgi:hypothetical protein